MTIIFKMRIVGGVETGVNEYPMMAGLVDANKNFLFCGATIINERQVLTAAHCLDPAITQKFAVLVGDHDWTTGILFVYNFKKKFTVIVVNYISVLQARTRMLRDFIQWKASLNILTTTQTHRIMT